MTTFTFANFVSTTLAGAVTNSATTITLSSAANLPASITSGSVLALVLNDVATRTNYEIVYATAISGATLTVTRAQEGTAARAWSVGDYVYITTTAGQMGSFFQGTPGTVSSVGVSGGSTGLTTTGGPVTGSGTITLGGTLAITNGGTGATTAAQAIANLGAAAIAGSSSQTFNVATATLGAHAINLALGDARYAALAQFGFNGSANGYQKLPSGMIIQWGSFSSGNPSTATFPIAFPNACLNVVVCEGNANSGTWGAGRPTTHGAQLPTKTGYTSWAMQWSGSAWIGATLDQAYIAIGY